MAVTAAPPVPDRAERERPPIFELAALDMAGTTVQEGGAVYRAVAEAVEARLGRPVPDDVLHRWTGTSKDEAIAGLLTDLDGSAPAEVVAEVYAGFVERLTAAYAATPPTAIPGAAEAIGRLRAAGVKVVLQTGYSRDIAESILDALGWTVGETVDGLVANDDVPLSRPAPYLVFRAMELARVTDVGRVLVAGDTPNDLAAGRNAGAGFVVGVLTGAATAADLGGHRHTHLLPSVADLPSLL
ncbi:phosphonatase-like hydrolase [Streptosporangium sp. G11]|uniref:phosphonatase-like hydrolase n=1 Tax=Streptosporangium sp. G11 TaxID=3436926 RepID=UPI003EBF6FD7